MNAINRYWNALDDASRKAVKKASFAGLILGIVLIAAMLVVYFDVLFLGTMGDSAPTQFALLPAFFVAAIAIAIYQYVLVYRAHKAIKANLFAHPAPGRRTPETWSGTDGLILALALMGVTCIPSAIAGVATDLILMAFGHAQNASLLSNFLWPIVGLLLAPIAAKRSIPLPPEIDDTQL